MSICGTSTRRYELQFSDVETDRIERGEHKSEGARFCQHFFWRLHGIGRHGTASRWHSLHSCSFSRPRLNIPIFYYSSVIFWIIAYDIYIYVLGHQITSVWCPDLCRVALCTCSIAVRRQLVALALKKSIPHRSAVMDANVPDFVSTVSKTIVIIAVNSLLASFTV